jgi:hypothetical protein
VQHDCGMVNKIIVSHLNTINIQNEESSRLNYIVDYCANLRTMSFVKFHFPFFKGVWW